MWKIQFLGYKTKSLDEDRFCFLGALDDPLSKVYGFHSGLGYLSVSSCPLTQGCSLYLK